MRNLKWICLAIALLFASSSRAQGTHQVTLTFTPSVDGGVVTVYRAPGACSTSSVFSTVTTGLAVSTYVDTGLSVGTYCYEVTTVVNGTESLPSNQVTARILPASPTTLVAVPK
jgi:hypothetical protein